MGVVNDPVIQLGRMPIAKIFTTLISPLGRVHGSTLAMSSIANCCSKKEKRRHLLRGWVQRSMEEEEGEEEEVWLRRSRVDPTSLKARKGVSVVVPPTDFRVADLC